MILFKYTLLVYYIFSLNIFYYASHSTYLYLLNFLPDYIEYSGILIPKLTQWLLSQNRIKDKKIQKALNRLLHSQHKSINSKPPKIKNLVYISNRPISHGCVGAVYKALYHDKEVCVKVVHDKSKQMLINEITYVKVFMKCICLFSNQIKIIIETICFFEWLDSINKQCNLNIEGENQTLVRNFTKNIQNFKIPEVYKYDYNYIVMEWIDGVHISEKTCEKLDKYTRKKLAFALGYSYFFTTFCRDCPIHGDMHIGNYLIDKNNKLVMIDFGICYLPNNKIKKYTSKAASTPVLNLNKHIDVAFECIVSNPLNITKDELYESYKKTLPNMYKIHKIMYEEKNYDQKVIHEFFSIQSNTEIIQKESLEFVKIYSNLKIIVNQSVINFVLNSVLFQEIFSILEPVSSDTIVKIFSELQKDKLTDNKKPLNRYKKMLKIYAIRTKY